MKRMAYIIFILLTIVFPAALYGAEQAQVISQFEKKVELFEQFFQAAPKVIEQQEYSKSPSGYIYFYNQYKFRELSYDIKKTSSLISPYTGYIDLGYIKDNSAKCGDVNTVHGLNFSSLEKLIAVQFGS